MTFFGFFFPTEDLRQAAETAKRILMKEKIERQLASQSTSASFMRKQDGYGNINKRLCHLRHKIC